MEGWESEALASWISSLNISLAMIGSGTSIPEKNLSSSSEEDRWLDQYATDFVVMFVVALVLLFFFLFQTTLICFQFGNNPELQTRILSTY